MGVSAKAAPALDPARAVQEDLDLLYDTVRDLTSTLPEHELLGRLLERTLSRLEAEVGSLALLDAEGRLRLVLSCGLPPEALTETRMNPREGVSGFVLACERPLRIDDVALDPRFELQAHERHYANCFAGAPVRIRGELRGVLNMCDRPGRAPFRESELSLLEAVAGHASVVLHNVERYDELLDRAERDVLTGVRNRGAFSSIVKAEVGRARRHSRPLALVMVDVDGFKAINDKLGRLTGERVLREIAEQIAASCRSHDTVARLESDRFGILLPEGDLEGALAFGEKIRRQVELGHPAGSVPDMPEVTISIGVVTYPDGGESVPELLASAETKLARAHDGGGNTVRS